MTDILQCTPMRAAESNTPPTFALPPGACDAHFHVFEPGYPRVPDPLYTFPDGTLAAYLAMTEALGIERMVLVQPTFYGTDNSLLADVLRRLGPRCGGVVRIEEDATDAKLDARPRAAGTCSSTRRARSSATCCRSWPTSKTPSSSTTWAT